MEVDVKCMQTNFGGCGLLSFRDFAPFYWPSKTAKFSFQTMDYYYIQEFGLLALVKFVVGLFPVHKGQKIELAQKIYASKG